MTIPHLHTRDCYRSLLKLDQIKRTKEVGTSVVMRSARDKEEELLNRDDIAQSRPSGVVREIDFQMQFVNGGQSA